MWLTAHAVVVLLVLTFRERVTTSVIRTDTFDGKVCGGRPPAVYVAGAELSDVRSKLHCVVLCQQRSACTSVTFSDKTCSLFTSYTVPCADRAELSAGAEESPVALEKVRSNWCTHGGHVTVNTSCSCQANYRAEFCQIGKVYIEAAE